MKRLVYFLGSMIALLAVLLVACDEKEEETDVLVGTYVFTSATFNDNVTIIVSDQEVVFPPGSDASAFVGPGLLSAAPCDNPQNAAIELSKEGKANFVCVGEAGTDQMGTWSINAERTVLKLNISNPAPFSLDITDLETTSTTFSGTVGNFPLPKDAGVELGGILPGPEINYQVGSVDLTFTRIP